jgi:hypothetical protein
MPSMARSLRPGCFVQFFSELIAFFCELGEPCAEDTLFLLHMSPALCLQKLYLGGR